VGAAGLVAERVVGRRVKKEVAKHRRVENTARSKESIGNEREWVNQRERREWADEARTEAFGRPREVEKVNEKGQIDP
jgi:hypothetical protein